MMKLASLRTSVLAVVAFAAIATTATASPELEQLTAEEQRARWQAAITTAAEEKEAEAFKVFDILAQQEDQKQRRIQEINDRLQELDRLDAEEMLAIERQEAEDQQKVDDLLNELDKIDPDARIEVVAGKSFTLAELEAEVSRYKRRKEIEYENRVVVSVVVVIALFVLGLIGWVIYLIASALLSFRRTKMEEWRERREGRAYKNDLDDFGAKP